MATKYADFDLATGNNDGSDWTNAWQTMADAIAGSNSAPPAAGDTVLCRGTDTLAGGVTCNLVGDSTDLIKFIGVDASGDNVGGTTRAVLDADGGNFDVMSFGCTFVLFENFRFTGSGNGHGSVATAGSNNFYINCSWDNNGSYGMRGHVANVNTFIMCVAYGNVSVGMFPGIYNKFIFCSSHDNGYGFLNDTGYYTDFIGSVAYDNTNEGFQTYQGLIMNCVSDGNGTYGVKETAYTTTFIGNRITNQSGVGDIGLYLNNREHVYGWNVLDNNKDNLSGESKAHPILVAGVDTNISQNEDGAGGGDTNQGYVSTTDGSEDYSTNYVSGTDPHLRRTAITIPTS